MNPPFPYYVIIRREISSSNPFSKEEESPLVIYEGVADYDSNRFPTIKDNVQVGKYNMYIPNRMLAVRKGDSIELTMPNNEIIYGEIVDYMPTNFGLTIKWDNVNN